MLYYFASNRYSWNLIEHTDIPFNPFNPLIILTFNRGAAMRGVALSLRQPTLPLRQGAVPQRGEGVDNQFNLVDCYLSTREHGDTEGLDSELCCSADKSKCICFSLKNSILETNVSATDVAGI